MKILLIEDSKLSRNMFKRSLGDEHQYLEAADGMSGIETYFIEKPDLVILDLTMPGMTGIDVLAQLKNLDPKARVIVGTADVQDFSRQKVIELGADAIIQKPFTHQTVLEVVRSVVEKMDRPG